MKASEVLQILQITRPTLTKYVKTGKIKVTVKGNGQYDYDTESVYKMLNKDIERKTYLYARVSTPKQKKDLDNQIQLLKNYSFQNGYVVSGVFFDIASGISFANRKEFFTMLDDIIAGKVRTVIITYKDRLSRVGFELFSYLFKKHGCEIVVISEVGSEELDSEEISEEIISLLHCYSMNLDSKHKTKKITDVLREKEDK